MNHTCTMCGEPVELIEGYRTPCRCDRDFMTGPNEATVIELAPRRTGQLRPSASESSGWDAAA